MFGEKRLLPLLESTLAAVSFHATCKVVASRHAMPYVGDCHQKDRAASGFSLWLDRRLLRSAGVEVLKTFY
jgi:hypothetical protein